MTTELIDLYNGQPGATDTTLYTCPANTTVRILAANMVNDTTTPAYLSAHRVPSGDSVGDDNLIVNRKVAGNRASVQLWELIGQVLEAGDVLSAIAEAADQITVHVSGVAVT
jgi:predicted RNase H-like nuclease